MARYQKYTGLILKKFPMNEADELLTVYTKEKGKIRMLARGVRKIQSRLAGVLQSLNEIEFEIYLRSARQASLPTLISVRANTVNDYLRENLKKFAYALVGIETLYRITPDEEPNQEIYHAMLDFLRDLGERHEENLSVRMFQLKLLYSSGYEFPGKLSGKLTSQAEQEIDRFLDYVLEREIKSKNFLNHAQ